MTSTSNHPHQYTPVTTAIATSVPQHTWDDTFFDGEDDDEIIAVFDFDYDLIESFDTKIGFVTLAATSIFPPIFGLSLLGCVPCFLRRNVEWSARCQHVALTPDGIRFVRDRRKTCCGLSCTDAGRSSKTVPYDMITDCDVEEPAGNAMLLCIPNVLTTVDVDTASSGGAEGEKELRITGLKDPVGFKRRVWAMKRSIASRQRPAGGGACAEFGLRRRGTRGGDGKGDAPQIQEDESVATLLREIRDELRGLRKSGDVGAVRAVTEMVDVDATTAADVRDAAADDTGVKNVV